MKRLLLTALLLSWTGLAPVSAADERPNLLWITAEDLSPNLGCYGDAYARTLNLDAFAREAVRYTNAFSTAPVCAPSRVTLVTGVHANSLGNPHLRCEMTLPPDFQGYPVELRRAGYFTTNNVKTDYNLANEPAIVRAWWDRSDARAHWRQRPPGRPFLAVFNIMDTHQSRLNVWSEEQFEREIGARLPRDQRADPATVPVPALYPDLPVTRKAMARYYDCIAAMDQRVGEILRELAADGLAENTIVFYYADHGMGMPGGKRLLRDTGTRVPLLVRFPPKWAHLAPGRPGTTTDRLVTFADFAPTLLSLAGAPVPAHFQGMAFLGAAAGGARRYAYAARDRVDEAIDTARSVRDARWLYIRNYRPHRSWAPPEWYSDQSAFRRELRALAAAGRLGSGPTAWLAPTRPREELYDTQSDPDQLTNLADRPEHAATLGRLRAELRRWLVEVRDLAFLSEEQTFTRAAGEPPYLFARKPGAYPMERVLDAAELVGDATAAARQRALLSDPDSGVRLWAATGLQANPAAARAARAELERALEDASPSVQVEAAGALVALGAHEPALTVLGAAVEGADLNVALHAARTLELLGEPARPLLAKLDARCAIARTREADSTGEFYLRMSLSALGARLRGE